MRKILTLAASAVLALAAATAASAAPSGAHRANSQDGYLFGDSIMTGTAYFNGSSKWELGLPETEVAIVPENRGYYNILDISTRQCMTWPLGASYLTETTGPANCGSQDANWKHIACSQGGAAWQNERAANDGYGTTILWGQYGYLMKLSSGGGCGTYTDWIFTGTY